MLGYGYALCRLFRISKDTIAFRSIMEIFVIDNFIIKNEIIKSNNVHLSITHFFLLMKGSMTFIMQYDYYFSFIQTNKGMQRRLVRV